MSIMTLSSSSSPHKQWRSHSQQRSESSSWASWSTTTHTPASSSTCPRCPRATAARMVTVCSPTFRASSWRSEIVVDKFLCQYPDHPRAPLGPAAPPRSSPRLYRSLMVKRGSLGGAARPWRTWCAKPSSHGQSQSGRCSTRVRPFRKHIHILQT